ncbi:disintegrin and metalloproteinase domain-containing protein 10-like [Montipora capricornis]|uniref:disintegrin and metalloproteinase domain-containing protein 10-like n=1 Tax=Montipora foliosa TaxID=591990 RepID=UPI0035F1078C
MRESWQMRQICRRLRRLGLLRNLRLMTAFYDGIFQVLFCYSIFGLMLEGESTRNHTEDILMKGFPFFQRIKYYDAVDYDVVDIHRQHVTATHVPQKSVIIKFTAFKRKFSLVLKQHKKLFLNVTKFRILVKDAERINTDYEPSTAYTGTVQGDPSSFVMGHIIQGHFDGSFSAFGETFYLERAERHFDEGTFKFHSIIFPASSAEFDFSRVQWETLRFKDLYRDSFIQVTSKRIRRRSPQNSSLNTCVVHIAADHSFFKNVGGGSERASIEEMVYSIGMADRAFRATDFNQDGGPGDGIGFFIAAVTVFTDVTAEGSLSSPEDIESTQYLLKWSEIDHDEYCMALLFTYRDFNNGVLGLAWVATPDLDTPGGICTKKVLVTDEEKTINFNTAIATFQNFGIRVPRKVSVITVTHEFGHSFGSEHDPETSQCSPGGKAGNFVMYSGGIDGQEPNNLLFSPCSKEQISAVISVKGVECFTGSNGSYCGNRIIEEGEECDCGKPDECDYVDKCCVARNDSLGIPGCTVREGKQCSRVAGTCCTEDCALIPESKTHVCHEETECSSETTCNGQSGRCPPAESKPRNVTCNDGSNTCLDGACTGPICTLYGLNECECYQNEEEVCHVCCKGIQRECMSARHFHGRVIHKRPGSTCKNHKGYCDSFGICVTVDSDDKLRDAFDRLFSKESMDSLLDWLKSHWYSIPLIVGGMCLGFVLLRITYRTRTNPFSLARQVLLMHIVRHRHQAPPVQAGTRQIPVMNGCDIATGQTA